MPTLPAEYQVQAASPFETTIASAPPVNVQQFLPPTAAKPIAPDDQKEISHALHRFLPKRLFPSNLTPVLDTVSDPMPMAVLSGAGTGILTALVAGVYAKGGLRTSGVMTSVAALAGGALMGGLTGIQTFINKRNHNEDVVDAYSRGMRTEREWDSDPVRQKQLDRQATINASQNAALTNALVYSALTPRYSYNSSY